MEAIIAPHNRIQKALTRRPISWGKASTLAGWVLDSAPKNRFGLTVIFSFNLVQLKGIYQNFAISRAFNIAPRPLKILKDFLKDLGKKQVNA